MKTEKTVEVPATTRVEVDHYTCDLCGKTTKDTDNWGGNSYMVDEVEVRMRTICWRKRHKPIGLGVPT